MNFEDLHEMAKVKRLWILMPAKKDLFVPGFDGTFLEAVADATTRAALNETSYSVYECDPEKYRRDGGLKALWAVIRIPEESPLRRQV